MKGPGTVELRDIEIFLTLAEELHFSRTAERLHVSPARVSQAIKKQERTIGAELFERTSRQVALTAVGRQLRADLEVGYRQIQQAIATASSAARGLTGVLKVGFSSAWCGNLVVRAADRFRARHPGCEIEIVEMPLHDRFGALRAGDIDLQLTELPVDEPDIVNGPVIYRDQRALTVPAGHPLARRESVCLEDLASIPLITITGPPQYWLDAHLPHHTPAGRTISRGPATIAWQEALSLVAAGKGACPTSIRSARYYARPDLAYIPFLDAPPVEFGLSWPSTGESVTVRAFVGTLVETADEEGPT
ncbi:LysR family transcriptional regulator [Streptomyces sp. NPDC050516]|uniref:LysR family transcriptional regulator n=1 Tax=Streptomyces sp. NPDC050516 TaxID=3365621 RepID=UPI0037937495